MTLNFVKMHAHGDDFVPDGSSLETCGSATRGVADMLMREANSTSVLLRTHRGVLTCVRESGQRSTWRLLAPRWKPMRFSPARPMCILSRSSTVAISACVSGNVAAVSRRARAPAVAGRSWAGFAVAFWTIPSRCNVTVERCR